MAAADGDGTAKRAWPGSPSDDLDVKRRRTWLTLGRGDVGQLPKDGVQEWASAVLKAGGLDDGDVAEAMGVFQAHKITGAAVTTMTEEKLERLIGAGPAQLLVSRLAPSPPLAAMAAPAEQFDVGKEEGRKRLVEALREQWGLREDRFDRPALLTTDKFSFAKTQERAAAFAHLLSLWKVNFDAGGNAREQLDLPALPAAPGMGKTRFCWLSAAKGHLPGQPGVVDAEWAAAMTGVEDSEFKTGIEKAVGLAVTFNLGTEVVPGERHEHMVGVRMLYGHFCDDTAVTFVDFLELLRNHGSQHITSTTALQIIERDIKANHALDGGPKRHVILVVDESLKAITADKGDKTNRLVQLGAVISSVTKLLTDHPHVHVLMTSLSGDDLVDASKTPVTGRTLHFIKGFVMLSKGAVQALVAAEPDPRKQARLRDDRFRAVLSECLGVPRLLEKVFEAAESAQIHDDSPCDTVRAVVALLFKSHRKYGDRNHRYSALLAALSFWRPAGDARVQKTRDAEREGYLFFFGRVPLIPPLLLKWWWGMDDECRQADEMHALLQAANGIYALSDEVGEAEHGPRFERQLAHLWRILTITDAVSRREAGDHRPRTIHGMLGSGQLAGADDAVSARSLDEVTAAFNKGLGEVGAGRLLRPREELDKPAAGPTDVPADPVHGTPYFPKDKQNPGFDFAMEEPGTGGGGGVQVLVEAKFSAEEATTAPLSQAAIVDKYVKAIQGRPTVRERLLVGQLCYVIGGLREVQEGVMQDVGAVVSAIVDALRHGKVVNHQRLHQLVRGSLVLLTRGHTEALLTSTLSSLPPFGERW